MGIPLPADRIFPLRGSSSYRSNPIHPMRYLITLCCVALSLPLYAEPNPERLTEEQLSKVLDELENVEAAVTGKRLSTRSSAVEAFRAASSSDKAAYEFYLACVKELRFDARDARASEFREWKDRNENRMGSDVQMTVMRLQLQYLVLTLRRAEGVEMEKLVPELESFVAGIAANIEELDGGMRELRGSVLGTVFAEAYELNKSLQMKDWSFTPGNISSVYNDAIFPFYRVEHPDLLAGAWDKYIALETQMTAIQQAENPIALENFQTERLPSMKWNRAVDLFENYSQPQGSLEMLAVLQANASHPQASKWVDDFKKRLATSPTQPAEQTIIPAKDAPTKVDANGFDVP